MYSCIRIMQILIKTKYCYNYNNYDTYCNNDKHLKNHTDH